MNEYQKAMEVVCLHRGDKHSIKYKISKPASPYRLYNTGTLDGLSKSDLENMMQNLREIVKEEYYIYFYNYTVTIVNNNDVVTGLVYPK